MSRKRHIGVIFGNHSYHACSYENLPGVISDLDKMKAMLHGYERLIVRKNICDIGAEIQKIGFELSGEELKHIHFHFSGKLR